MPGLVACKFDPVVCGRQLKELGTLLQRSAELSERQILKFFRTKAQLSLFLGSCNPVAVHHDRLAWEYRLFGDFQCDIVVGDSARNTYTFIEIEDAGPKSLFTKRGKKATREWSPRFDHGYSQIVDWFYKLQVMTDTPDMEDRFGKRAIDYTGVLIVGRDQHMSAGERMRLAWRRDHVVVHSKKIMCMTFDRLLDDLTVRLASYALESHAVS
jgi:hypothetical protein